MKIISTGVVLVFLTGLAASPAMSQSLGVPSTTGTFPPAAAPPPTVPATAPTASRPNLATVPASAPEGRQPNLALAGAGFAIFLATWVPAVIVSVPNGCDGYVPCKDASGVIMVPLVGPFLASPRGDYTPYVLWSLAQGGGLAMLVAGIVGHHPAPEQHATSSWAISPVASRDATGFILRATF
jgi:hypothetical protein